MSFSERAELRSVESNARHSARAATAKSTATATTAESILARRREARWVGGGAVRREFLKEKSLAFGVFAILFFRQRAQTQTQTFLVRPSRFLAQLTLSASALVSTRAGCSAFYSCATSAPRAARAARKRSRSPTPLTRRPPRSPPSRSARAPTSAAVRARMDIVARSFEHASHPLPHKLSVPPPLQSFRVVGNGRCSANDKCVCFKQQGLYTPYRYGFSGADCSQRESSLLVGTRCTRKRFSERLPHSHLSFFRLVPARRRV